MSVTTPSTSMVPAATSAACRLTCSLHSTCLDYCLCDLGYIGTFCSTAVKIVTGPASSLAMNTTSGNFVFSPVDITGDRITFPSTFLNKTVNITFGVIARSSYPPGFTQSNLRLVSPIKIFQPETLALSSNSIGMSLSYDPGYVNDQANSSLAIYRYNDRTQLWEMKPTLLVDSANLLVTTTTNQLGKYAILEDTSISQQSSALSGISAGSVAGIVIAFIGFLLLVGVGILMYNYQKKTRLVSSNSLLPSKVSFVDTNKTKPWGPQPPSPVSPMRQLQDYSYISTPNSVRYSPQQPVVYEAVLAHPTIQSSPYSSLPPKVPESALRHPEASFRDVSNDVEFQPVVYVYESSSSLASLQQSRQLQQQQYDLRAYSPSSYDIFDSAVC